MFGFIKTKRLNIDSFTNKNWHKLSVIGVKFPGEKKKKFVVNKVLWIISYKNVKARALGHLENVNTFCDKSWTGHGKTWEKLFAFKYL